MSITAPSTVVLITGILNPTPSPIHNCQTNISKGANSGIGLAAAEVIVSASKEYHVIIGSRNVKNGTKAVEQLLATPGRYGTVSSVQIDVTDQASITKAASEIEERFGRVDVLVNNAGIGTLPLSCLCPRSSDIY
jgi:NAD(P)-dependent dehydrogenase (short-subunit alcohol dehydrogenase family)